LAAFPLDVRDFLEALTKTCRVGPRDRPAGDDEECLVDVRGDDVPCLVDVGPLLLALF